VKVIAPPHPLATHGPASSYGGGQYNLVVTTDGRVLAWGANSGGVLGQGQSATELVSLALPTPVKDGTGQSVLTGIVAASAGNTSALALSEEGEVYSWGSSQALGRTAANGDPLPKKVLNPSATSSIKGIVAASVGDDNAVALADDGTVYSWGYYSGRPGPDPKSVPGIVDVGGKAVAVSAGWNWSAALLADGRIVTWGFGTDGRQGQPGASNPAAPGLVMDQATGQPLDHVVAISAGYNFGLALKASGQLYAWGNNSSGQLGQGTTGGSVDAAVAVKAPGGAAPLGNIVMAVAGGNHALALDATGKVWSWGYSQNGELGDGVDHPRLNSSALPGAVVSPAGTLQLGDVASLAAGYAHSLALGNDGSLWIWGSGFRGNLGQGGTSGSNVYVPVAVKSEAGTGLLSLAPLNAWPNLKQRALP
jgi:alpha-tubulin suppressor-like RCC1 family protein